MSLKPNYGWRAHDFAYRRLEEDARINILTGSVRSGKTWALHPKILGASNTESPITGWRVLVGQTKEMVYMNVLKDLFDWIGIGESETALFAQSRGYVPLSFLPVGAVEQRTNVISIRVLNEILMPVVAARNGDYSEYNDADSCG